MSKTVDKDELDEFIRETFGYGSEALKYDTLDKFAEVLEKIHCVRISEIHPDTNGRYSLEEAFELFKNARSKKNEFKTKLEEISRQVHSLSEEVKEFDFTIRDFGGGDIVDALGWNSSSCW